MPRAPSLASPILGHKARPFDSPNACPSSEAAGIPPPAANERRPTVPCQLQWVSGLADPRGNCGRCWRGCSNSMRRSSQEKPNAAVLRLFGNKARPDGAQEPIRCGE